MTQKPAWLEIAHMDDTYKLIVRTLMIPLPLPRGSWSYVIPHSEYIQLPVRSLHVCPCCLRDRIVNHLTHSIVVLL